MTECTGHEFLRVKVTFFLPLLYPQGWIRGRQEGRQQAGGRRPSSKNLFWGDRNGVTGVSQKEQLAKVPGQSPLTFQASASGPHPWSLWSCLFHVSSICVLPSKRSSWGVGHLSPSSLAPRSSLGWCETHSGCPVNTSPSL